MSAIITVIRENPLKKLKTSTTQIRINKPEIARFKKTNYNLA